MNVTFIYAPTMPTKIILDCDPGHDDAVALLLAWGNPDIELVGVTTVAGNQTIDKVTRNALAIAQVAGITGVPFARGAHRPLVREVEVAEGIHGESGLDGPVLPEPTIELDPRHAVDFIIDTVMAAEPGEITLVPTGALTNIASRAKEPRIAERVKQSCSWARGQRGQLERDERFNIVIDPEAAHTSSTRSGHSRWSDSTTHEALVTPEVAARSPPSARGPALVRG